MGKKRAVVRATVDISVKIMDASSLLPLSRELADKYTYVGRLAHEPGTLATMHEYGRELVSSLALQINRLEEGDKMFSSCYTIRSIIEGIDDELSVSSQTCWR